MVYLLIGAAAIIGIMGASYIYANKDAKTILRYLRWLGLIIAILLAIWLIVFNRGAFLWTIIPLLAPWFSWQTWLGKFVAWLVKRRYQKYKEKKGGGEKTEQGTGKKPASRNPPLMSRREAELILGVAKSASESEIRTAYTQKMQKAHPDKGGDEEAAKIINSAYDRLQNHE